MERGHVKANPGVGRFRKVPRPPQCVRLFREDRGNQAKQKQRNSTAAVGPAAKTPSRRSCAANRLESFVGFCGVGLAPLAQTTFLCILSWFDTCKFRCCLLREASVSSFCKKTKLRCSHNCTTLPLWALMISRWQTKVNFLSYFVRSTPSIKRQR